jgi:signal transduction histidine kinase
MDEILYQILMIFTIIAVIVLIVVLVRLYLVLTDINDTTRITKKRAQEIDLKVGEFMSLVAGALSFLKGVVASAQNVNNIKNKIVSFFDSETKTNNKEDDEQKKEK